MKEKGKEDTGCCVVCGADVADSALCERCCESLRLCDAENYAARKIAAKNTRAAAQTLSNTDDL